VAGDNGTRLRRFATRVASTTFVQRSLSATTSARGGRTDLPEPEFDREQDRVRNIVERVIGWLKNLRQIDSRVEKLAMRYVWMITPALVARTATGLSSVTHART
jgi:hypothetical protein